MSAFSDAGRSELTWWESARTSQATPSVLLLEHAGAPRRLRAWLGAGPAAVAVASWSGRGTGPTPWKVEPVSSLEMARGLLKVRDPATIVIDGAIADVASAVAMLRAEARGRSLPILVVGAGEPIARAVRVPDDPDLLRGAVAEAIAGPGDVGGAVELAALFVATDVPILGVDAAGVVLYANVAAAHALGVAGPEALVDHVAQDVVPVALVASRRRVPPGSGRLDAVWTLSDDAQKKQREARLFNAQRLVAMGELTSGILHDFNNVLTAVIGNLSEVVHSLELGPDTREAVQDALTAAIDGANLTRRLGARATNGRPRAVDLGETLGEFGRIMRRVIRREVKLDLQLAEDVSAVLDRSQLESAVMNLVLNAQHAIEGAGNLRLVVRRDGDRAVVVVADDGRGMSPETLARATEAFFTTRGDNGGTGLGLAMVDDFVRRFGGTLALQSALGHGTSVTLTFPWVAESSPRTSVPLTQNPPDVKVKAAAKAPAERAP